MKRRTFRRPALRWSRIYVNAEEHGREWGQPASLELLNPDERTTGFQIEMGLRIRGGYSGRARRDANPKHSFRMFFRSEYGDSKLVYPLFDDEGVDEFDRIDLRTTQNFSWATADEDLFDFNALFNSFVRDEFSRDAQGLMGQPYTRSRYYHLYINGSYWGLYETQERVTADYAASYFGGNPEDYDAIKSTGYEDSIRGITPQNEANDGNLDAYRRLWEAFDNPNSGDSIANGSDNDGRGLASNVDYFRIQGMNPDGTRNPLYERLLDVDAVIDYAILTYYTGDADGPGTKFFKPGVNNYNATIDRENPDGFKFYEHDSEWSLDRGDGSMVTPLTYGGDEFRYFNPHWMHEQLAQTNAEYVTRFSDRVHEIFFNDGILARENSDALIDFRANQIDSAIVAESARWGSTSLDKTTWEAAVNNVHNFFINRTTTVVNQFLDQNWYLETDAPTAAIHE